MQKLTLKVEQISTQSASSVTTTRKVGDLKMSCSTR